MDNKRKNLIIPSVLGKSVLDLGGYGFKKGSRVMLDIIKKNSSNYLCVDNKKIINEEYNIVEANAETFKSRIKYDVIHAGELIEHLDNVGSFLENCKLLLNQNGKLIISTPNAYSFRYLFYFLTTGKEPRGKEHVLLYSKTTIKEMLDRHNFKNIKIKYIQRNDVCGLKELIEYFIAKLIKPLSIGLYVECTLNKTEKESGN